MSGPVVSGGVLHGDDTSRDGNLTAEEYEATYAEGDWCGPSADEIAAAERAVTDRG